MAETCGDDGQVTRGKRIWMDGTAELTETDGAAMARLRRVGRIATMELNVPLLTARNSFKYVRQKKV